MQEFDRLPAELRSWLSTAILPWRARSVLRAYERAVARTGNTVLALQELDRLEQSKIAKDAALIWGPAHPAAAFDPDFRSRAAQVAALNATLFLL